MQAAGYCQPGASLGCFEPIAQEMPWRDVPVILAKDVLAAQMPMRLKRRP